MLYAVRVDVSVANRHQRNFLFLGFGESGFFLFDVPNKNHVRSFDQTHQAADIIFQLDDFAVKIQPFFLGVFIKLAAVSFLH